MRYVGMQTQIRRNNTYSVLLLLAFPCIILTMVWVMIFAMCYFGEGEWSIEEINTWYLFFMPWVLLGVAIWFAIAYSCNASMVRFATGSEPVSRRECPRLYNIVENLCMTAGMEMPNINIIIDYHLNAFASGIDKKSYTVTVTTGLMDKLSDDELAGVIGHELTHIRNRDTRLLITSIIFVGIISTLMNFGLRILLNSFLGGSSSSKKKGDGKGAIIILVMALVFCVISYLFALLTQSSISRRREYMADAGGAELCGNPMALASALRKIDKSPELWGVTREDIAQLFIIHPHQESSGLMKFANSLFNTHPETYKRIKILEQF